MLATKNLNNSEVLFIDRFRRGESQQEASTRMNITTWHYRRMEIGKLKVVRPNIGDLAPNEACRIMRRRAGMSRTALSIAVGVTPWWVTVMERGRSNCQILIDFWSKS